MPHPLPTKLLNPRLSVATRLRELDAWLAREDADPAADAYLATFLEAQLRTGRPEVAHAAGIKAAQGKDPALPSRDLDGAEDIRATPPDWRSAVEIALVAAGRRARTRPGLLTSLFRSLLLWPTKEREVAMDALVAASPSDAALAAGLRDILAELSRVKDEPGNRLLPVIQAGLSEPRWLVALCEALHRGEAGARALMQLRHAHLPDPAELFPALWSEDEEEVAALIAVQCAGPPLQRALSTLALAAVPDSVRDEELVRVLSDESLPDWLREESASWLLFRGARTPELGPLAERILLHCRSHGFREKLELLRQLAAPALARAPVHTPQVHLLPIESRIASGPALVNGNAVFLLVRTLREFPDGSWRCAEEEAALGVLSPSGDLSLRPLPLRLPSHPTGAAGAERVWGLELLFEGRLLISLRVPFSDQRGWGTENHLLAWDPAGQWFDVERTPTGIKMHLLSEPVSPVNEDRLSSWGYGELLLWKDGAGRLGSMNDQTPYHLEDSEPSDEVRKTRAVIKESERGWIELSRPLTAARSEGLILTEGRQSFRIAALEEVLRGLPDPLGTSDPLLLGGVLLAEGWLAVGLRSFVRTPTFRMYDSVARVAVPARTRKGKHRNGS